MVAARTTLIAVSNQAGEGPTFLRDWILNRLSRRPERWQDLHAAVRPEWWLPKHINELVRELKKEGTIAADPVSRRKFSAVLRLAKTKT
jgi:hypothetical protein